MTPTEILISALRDGGYRITAARRAVCAVMAEAGGEHLTAADIHARAQEAGVDLDRSTVYRTLDTLEEAGLVRHGHLGHSPAVYHLSREASHQHLVCSNCGRTIAMAGRDLKDTVDLIRSRTGFEVDVDHFALVGTCDHCTPSTETTAPIQRT